MNLNSEKTGRFLVVTEDGRKFVVEPLDGPPVHWGDINPATKQVEGSYGEKYPGSVAPADSIITPENGFKNIQTLPAGVSPISFIERMTGSGIVEIRPED
jgi:hypothetical protein